MQYVIGGDSSQASGPHPDVPAFFNTSYLPTLDLFSKILESYIIFCYYSCIMYHPAHLEEEK